jgi:hypothetical protein
MKFSGGTSSDGTLSAEQTNNDSDRLRFSGRSILGPNKTMCAKLFWWLDVQEHAGDVAAGLDGGHLAVPLGDPAIGDG